MSSISAMSSGANVSPENVNYEQITCGNCFENTEFEGMCCKCLDYYCRDCLALKLTWAECCRECFDVTEDVKCLCGSKLTLPDTQTCPLDENSEWFCELCEEIVTPVFFT